MAEDSQVKQRAEISKPWSVLNYWESFWRYRSTKLLFWRLFFVLSSLFCYLIVLGKVFVLEYFKSSPPAQLVKNAALALHFVLGTIIFHRPSSYTRTPNISAKFVTHNIIAEAEGLSYVRMCLRLSSVSIVLYSDTNSHSLTIYPFKKRTRLVGRLVFDKTCRERFSAIGGRSSPWMSST